MSDDQTAPSEPHATLSHPADRSEKIDRLLDAALLEFGRAGPDGARVAAIAAAAGMNKRLLYHYVGDKEALFAAVLEKACARVVERPEAAMPLEWRVICHAAAAGDHDSGLDGILERLAEPGAGMGAARLGLLLLVSLLPELADRVLGNEAGSISGREAALRQAFDQLGGAGRPPDSAPPAGADAPKPRLKMRPDLRASAGDPG